MKIVHVLIGAATVSAMSASAAQFKLVRSPSSLADWQNDAFYETAAPQGDGTEEVVLGKDMKARVDESSIAFVSKFLRIIPSEGSELIVSNDTDVTLGCAFTARVVGDSTRKTRGLLIKQGTAKLSLGSFKRFTQFDYDVNMRVEDGTLGLVCLDADPDNLYYDNQLIFQYGHVEVLENGTLALGNPNGLNSHWSVRNWFLSVSGSGVITNSPGALHAENCFFHTHGLYDEPAVFSGKLTGIIRNYHAGYQYFTGTNSTVTGEFRVYLNQGKNRTGTIAAMKIGADSTSDSSIGHNNGIAMGEGGSRFLYLGTGETTSKNWYLAETTEYGTKAPCIIDAGATGGLVLQGCLKPNTSGKLQRLHLTGSNTVPCRVEGEVANGSLRVHIVKKGTGEWQFLGNTKNRDAIAGYSIEEGVLAFDIMDEKGKVCALGPCRNFFTDEFCDITAATTVPYCFKMGGENTEGTLKYIGSDLLWSTTRPMALSGDARLVNAGSTEDGEETRFFYHSGISSVTPGMHTLTLAGEATAESVISNVTDGTAGSIGIAKEGSGTWTLGGNGNTFTGPIAVKEGKLVLRGVAGKFTWYKWSVREGRNKDAEAITGNLTIGTQIGEFGFFNADNARVGAGIVEGARLKSSEYQKQECGKCGYDYQVGYYEFMGANRNLTNLSDGVPGTLWGIKVYDPASVSSGSKVAILPEPDDPTTWVPIIFRLDPSSDEVRSYDMTSGGTGGGNGWKCGESALPKSWILEGSVDGVNWYTVHEVSDAPWPDQSSQSYPWLKGGQESNGKDLSTHTGGWQINGSTNAVTVAYDDNPVSVAPGATLEAEGLVRLGSLKVDAVNGAGTIRGFVLADHGTIDVVNLSEASSTTLPGEYDLPDGELNKIKNWSVSAAGKPKSSWSAIVKGGKITIWKPGLNIVIR